MVALYAILPQILPNVLSQYFYRFEVAIRTSLILGIIGAGGIGQQLFLHFKLFQYDKVAVDVIVVMVLVIVADAISTWVTKANHVREVLSVAVQFEEVSVQLCKGRAPGSG